MIILVLCNKTKALGEKKGERKEKRETVEADNKNLNYLPETTQFTIHRT